MPFSVRQLLRQGRRLPVDHIRARLVNRSRPGGRPADRQDMVSIIIPMYQVEDYLAECLDSVVTQTHGNLEIILVDDGSLDGSHDIAQSYARQDSRIRVIVRTNGGLGAARNTGVAEARGQYLTFADPDDTLPSDAIEIMVRSLERTGSDFAVGAIDRIQQGQSWSPGWVKRIHAANRERVQLPDLPEVLKDAIVCNKLFRTNFFHQIIGQFPVRIRYEDREPTARAYLNGVFDILTSCVYHWRIRDDGTSISQQKGDPEDLRDRVAVLQKVADVLSDATTDIYQGSLAKAIGFDLREYFELIPRTDVEFFDQLRNGMRPLADRMTPEAWQQVLMIDRLPALAVLAGHRQDIGTIISRREEYGWFLPAYVEDGHAFLDRQYLHGTALEPSANELRLGQPDLEVITKATRLWWQGAQLHLEGYAYLTNLAFDPAICSVSARLVPISTDKPAVEVNTRSASIPRIDMESRDSWNAHAQSGFLAEVNPTEASLDPAEVWQVEVSVHCNGLTRSAVIHDGDFRGALGTKVTSAATGPTRWMAGLEPDSGLSIQAAPAAELPVLGVTTSGRVVTVTAAVSPHAQLRLTSKSLGLTLDAHAVSEGTADDGEPRTSFHIVLPELTADDIRRDHLWSLRVYQQGTQHRLTFPGHSEDLHRQSPEHNRVRAVMTRAGTLRLLQNRWWAVADDVVVGTESIEVSGRIDAPGGAELRARMTGDRPDSQIFPADRAELDLDRQRFRIRIPFNTQVTAPESDSEPANLRALERGDAPRLRSGRLQPPLHHGMSVRLSVRLDSRHQERWLKVGEQLQHQFPTDRYASRYRLTFSRTRRAAALWVSFHSPHRPEERGRLAQKRLHEHFQTPQSAGGGLQPDLRDAVLFESYNGRVLSDSPLALCYELLRRDFGLDLYWTVTDLNTPVPDGTRKLLIHSQEWMDALHNSRYLVNNNNFPSFFRKRAGQTYIQTWHGTPLKQIGDDVPATSLSLLYRHLMARESMYWDYLLAQNEFAARTLPKAFDFPGQVLNIGYPRNDALVSIDADQRRSTARSMFGFRADQYVVLYAPTWRDNVSGPRGYALVNYLNFDAVRSVLGEDTGFLMRGHPNTSRHAASAQSGAINVTHYPDINDLLLASDVLVTDYSSVMFDYAVTGKPILFLTPDLAEYRDSIRGFYLDLAEIAPGPICMSNSELAAALSNLAGTSERYAARYRAFVDRFTPHDDGEAAARVVDNIWAASDRARHSSPETSTEISVTASP